LPVESCTTLQDFVKNSDTFQKGVHPDQRALTGALWSGSTFYFTTRSTVEIILRANVYWSHINSATEGSV